jgi:hypothetical protein
LFQFCPSASKQQANPYIGYYKYFQFDTGDDIAWYTLIYSRKMQTFAPN